MTVRISNSGHDENYRYRGGKAGDQTKDEWYIRYNYNRPWYRVLRLKDEKTASLMGDLAKEAAENDYIGYDQNERTTFWVYLSKAKYRPKNVKTKCEADCSAGVMALLKAVGYILGIKKLQTLPITSTHYMRDILLSTGLFEEFTSSRYTSYTSEYLKKGDILLKDDAHTATVIEDGKNSKVPKYDIYRITANPSLNVRDRASTITGKVLGKLGKGSEVEISKVKTNKSGNTWGTIASGAYKGKYIALIFKGNTYAKKVG